VGRIVAYTDGACIGNPGPGGWAAILVQDDQRQEISGGAPETTNNRMELTAVIEALRRLPPDAPARVVTDSQYVMNGITRWLAGWRRRGWRTAGGQPVLNRDLWEALAPLVGPRVTWEWVRGHAGHPENERVDALARAEARAQERARGITRDGPDRGQTPGTRWPTYLSLVDGEARRHADWPSCQARVHRQPGARFKKCASAAEERATLARWGLSPARLAPPNADG